MATRSDDITAKVLSLATHPAWEERGAVEALRPVVAGDQRSLRKAIARVRRFLAERPGAVADRASRTLEALLVERAGRSR